MSLDTGIIARKHKNSWKLYEINLSTRKRSFVEELKKTEEIDVMKRLDVLDKKITSECGQPYEGVWIERTPVDEKNTKKEIDALKSATARQMKRIIKRVVDKQEKAFKQYFILDEKHKLKQVEALEWAKWIEEDNNRRIVKQDHLMNGYFVSTVFLGLNHNFFGKSKQPLVFETIVFKPFNPFAQFPTEEHMERYSTWQKAFNGHRRAVRKYEQVLNFVLPINHLLKVLGIGGKNGKPRL
jgi:hypothetical protein